MFVATVDTDLRSVSSKTSRCRDEGWNREICCHTNTMTAVVA